MMQLQTPALRLLVLIFSLVPSDSSDSDRAACRRLFLGVSSMPLNLASRLSVSDPPGAGGGGPPARGSSRAAKGQAAWPSCPCKGHGTDSASMGSSRPRQ